MTFLEKYQLLRKSVPVAGIEIRSSINCEYSDYSYNCKNCYHCFEGYELRDGMYTIASWGDKLVDCDLAIQSEKCYQCMDSNKCHNCTYLIDSNNCTNCHFSAFLNSCNDCLGCVALTHKKYCIFNKQFSKGEYFKKIEELKKEDPEKILAQMFALKQQIPHPASQQFNSENSQYGNFINNSKNCYWAFNCLSAQDCGYIYTSGYFNDCWDTLMTYGEPFAKGRCERCYELTDSTDCYNCVFLFNCDDSTNCFYCADLKNCSDCFGCVGLTNKKYCILNNQMTKEQYEKAVKEIKKELGWRVS